MKNALIVGGSGALGGAAVRVLSESGFRVTLTSRSREKAEAVAKGYANTEGLECDVTDEKSIARLAAEVSSLAVVVLAAGGNLPEANVAPQASLESLSLSAAREVFESNFWSKLALVKALVPKLADSSSVITVGSMSGLTPLTRVGAYSAAMAAVHSLTKWLAVEFATKQSLYGKKIRVNGIAPGFIPAEQNMALLRDAKTGELTARGERIIQHTPLARFGTPEEIAGLIQYLADEQASGFVTGQLFPVDGGFSAMTI